MPSGFDSAHDLFAKVKRDHAAVELEVTPDAFFNFVVTAHCMRDWVDEDPAISADAKKACAVLVTANDWLRACRDLANGSKHFAIDRYEPLVENAGAASGFGMGRHGVGAYGHGEWSISVSWGGETHNALTFGAEVVKAWEMFFESHAPSAGAETQG